MTGPFKGWLTERSNQIKLELQLGEWGVLAPFWKIPIRIVQKAMVYTNKYARHQSVLLVHGTLRVCIRWGWVAAE